jgi:hypothetical protein
MKRKHQKAEARAIRARIRSLLRLQYQLVMGDGVPERFVRLLAISKSAGRRSGLGERKLVLFRAQCRNARPPTRFFHFKVDRSRRLQLLAKETLVPAQEQGS